jgi:hypothetical protein
VLATPQWAPRGKRLRAGILLYYMAFEGPRPMAIFSSSWVQLYFVLWVPHPHTFSFLFQCLSFFLYVCYFFSCSCCLSIYFLLYFFLYSLIVYFMLSFFFSFFLSCLPSLLCLSSYFVYVCSLLSNVHCSIRW